MAAEILCCLQCGASTGSNQKYCSLVCRRLHRKASPKRCLNCDTLFTPIKRNSLGRWISYNDGKLCSASCQLAWVSNNEARKRKISEAFTGDKHPNWQGGKAQLNNISHRGPNWLKQREAALKRYGRSCVDCGMTEAQCLAAYSRGLDIDHEVPFHNFGDYRKANRVSNLRPRCASCHKVAESKRTLVQMVLPMQDNHKRMHKGYARGEKVNTARLSATDVLAIRRRAGAGEQKTALAREFGVSKSAIGYAVAGKTWRHLPGVISTP
jgi:hypothetical protein